MNRSVCWFLGLLSLATGALASPTDCQSGMFSSFLAASFACQSGALTFSNFNYSTSATDGAARISDFAILVGRIDAPDTEGLTFSGGWDVSSNRGVLESVDSRIGYAVEDGTSLLDTLRLSFASVVTGSGVASVSEHFCLNTLYCLGGGDGGDLKVSNPGTGFSNVAFFAGTGLLSVVQDINVRSGVNGSASIQSVTNTFSSPEPLSFVLLGTGLLGIGLMRRRRGKR